MRLILIVVALAGLAGNAVANDNPIEQLKATAGKDPELLVRLGDLYVEAMRLDDAKRAYKQAKWKTKEAPEARFGIIKIYMAQNKFQHAKHFCRRLTAEHPKLSTGDVCSGHFWLGNARSSRAIESFERAVAKGDIARGKTGIGEAHRRMAKWDEALSAYNEALAANADYTADLGMGLVLEKKGDKAGAVAAVKKAVAKEPASSLARYHLGRLLGNTPEAVDELQTAVLIRPNWYDAFIELASVYEAMDRLHEATTAYEKAIKADPKRAEGNFGMAKVLFEQGKLDDALSALQKVVDEIPNHAGAYLLFAEIYYRKKEHDQAIEALDRARGVASGDVEVFIRSAEIYMELGRFTNARAFLSQVVSMRPKNSKAHMMLGDIACGRKQFEEGRKHYGNALEGDLKGVDKMDIQKKQSACHK